jgi:hypothetical protein
MSVVTWILDLVSQAYASHPQYLGTLRNQITYITNPNHIEMLVGGVEYLKTELDSVYTTILSLFSFHMSFDILNMYIVFSQQNEWKVEKIRKFHSICRVSMLDACCHAKIAAWKKAYAILFGGCFYNHNCFKFIAAWNWSFCKDFLKGQYLMQNARPTFYDHA